jgi:putative hydrolase of the HAD superfamily
MIQYLLFDLDNTLYPESTGFEDDTLRRMREFVASFLGLSFEDAFALQSSRPRKYGTTLEWLMTEHGLTDAEAYFRGVHPEGEEDILSPNPALAEMLDRIALPKAILTNSPREHAERVARKLGIEHAFSRIFDIRFNELNGKPHEKAYRRVVRSIGVDIGNVLFIDDMTSYVTGFVNIGGRGLLVDEGGLRGNQGLDVIPSIMDLEAYLAREEGGR